MCDGFDKIIKQWLVSCQQFYFDVAAAVLDGFSLCVDCAAGTFPQLVYTTSLSCYCPIKCQEQKSHSLFAMTKDPGIFKDNLL